MKKNTKWKQWTSENISNSEIPYVYYKHQELVKTFSNTHGSTKSLKNNQGFYQTTCAQRLWMFVDSKITYDIATHEEKIEIQRTRAKIITTKRNN